MMAHVPFPTVETYRGIGIHDFQSRERIETVVKPAIDRIHAENDPEALFDFAGNAAMPPEARRFAKAKCEAAFEFAASSRVVRPSIDLEKLRALTAGLASGWSCHMHYGSRFDIHHPDPSRAPIPRPKEYQDAMAAWQDRHR